MSNTLLDEPMAKRTAFGVVGAATLGGEGTFTARRSAVRKDINGPITSLDGGGEMRAVGASFASP
jgi:hypothetical protein